MVITTVPVEVAHLWVIRGFSGLRLVTLLTASITPLALSPPNYKFGGVALRRDLQARCCLLSLQSFSDWGFASQSYCVEQSHVLDLLRG